MPSERGVVRAGEPASAHVEASVIVATLGLSPAFDASLRAIVREAGTCGLPAEVLLAATPTARDSLGDIERVAEPLGARVVACRRRGKAFALVEAVGAASGNVLVLVDGDIHVQEGSLALLVEAIERGADVAFPDRRPAPLRRPGVVERMLWGWAEQWAEARNVLRRRRSQYNWALSGDLYAMRASFFPERMDEPVVDDMSVGLAAWRAGARFEFVPDAVSEFVAPATLREWFRQKSRTRRGAGRIARVAPELPVLRRTQRQAVLASRRYPLPARLSAAAQECVILVVAAVLERLLPVRPYWSEIASTKSWERTTRGVLARSTAEPGGG